MLNFSFRLTKTFHRTILLQANNQMLLNVLFGMSGHLTRARHLALKEMKRFPTIIEEHQELFEAVSSHRGEEAGELIDHHLDRLLHQLPAQRPYIPGGSNSESAV